MSEQKPVSKLDKLPDKLDGEHEEITLEMDKCKHDLEIITSTEVKCKNCGAGWTGLGVYKLLLANRK